MLTLNVQNCDTEIPFLGEEELKNTILDIRIYEWHI
jgi:hypothetical protein